MYDGGTEGLISRGGLGFIIIIFLKSSFIYCCYTFSGF